MEHNPLERLSIQHVKQMVVHVRNELHNWNAAQYVF